MGRGAYGLSVSEVTSVARAETGGKVSEATCMFCREQADRGHLCTAVGARVERSRRERAQQGLEIAVDIAYIRRLAEADGLVAVLTALELEERALEEWVRGEPVLRNRRARSARPRRQAGKED